MKKYKKIIILSLIIFLLDLIFKYIISSFIPLNSSIIVIKNLFNLTLVHNYGAAWSIFKNMSLFLILVSIIAIILIMLMIKKEKKITTYNSIYYGLILGGILGNLINRIFLGYVIDYLDFNIFGYDYPVFNLADSTIIISILMMVIDVIRGEK